MQHNPIAKPSLREAPKYLAVSLELIKKYLRVDGDDEDEVISGLVIAATQRLETYVNRKFVNQKWDIFFDCFPYEYNSMDDWYDGVREGAISQLYSNNGKLKMPFGPMNQLISFSTFDDTNKEYIFANSYLILDSVSPFGIVSLKIGNVWPQTILRQTNGIKVTGRFGFGEGFIPESENCDEKASEVPQDLQEAIKIMAAALYEHRGDEMPVIPATAQFLLEPYRRVQV